MILSVLLLFQSFSSILGKACTKFYISSNCVLLFIIITTFPWVRRTFQTTLRYSVFLFFIAVMDFVFDCTNFRRTICCSLFSELLTAIVQVQGEYGIWVTSKFALLYGSTWYAWLGIVEYIYGGLQVFFRLALFQKRWTRLSIMRQNQNMDSSASIMHQKV